MKRLLLGLCLLITSLLADHSSIVEERHHLFTLGVLSYLHSQREVQPKPGWDIAALIAWDVEKIDQTPEFVIDRNRNFEKQGNIFHAEIMAIEKAVACKFRNDPSKTAEELHKEVGQRLSTATLYSSLEPCPFCMLGISQCRIPQVVYFMQDPTTRDKETYDPLPLPKEFCGRKLTSARPSSLPLATQINHELQHPSEPYLKAQSDGRKVIDFASYFLERQGEVAELAYELFCRYDVIYEQNRALYQRLRQSVHESEPFVR